MSPIYAVLAAPLDAPAAAFRSLLWFTHWRALAARCGSPSGSRRGPQRRRRSRSRCPSRKLVAVGHGIEVPTSGPRAAQTTARCACSRSGARRRPRGSTTVDRGRAASSTASRSKLELRGPSLTDRGDDGRAAPLIASSALAVAFALEGPVARSARRRCTHAADALVNNMRAGALDKVVYEAAAAGLPVLVASEGSTPLVGGIEPPLRFAQDDAADARDAHRARCTTRAPERRRSDRRRAARARRARPLGRALGRRVWSRRRDDAGAARAEGLRRLRLGGAPPLAAAAAATRGWDARCSCCTRASRARASSSSGCARAAFPTEAWRMRFDLDPTVPARLAAPTAGRSCTPISSTPTCSACRPARSRVYRCASRPSTASTSSAPTGSSRAADRAAARFAHRQIAISARPRRYLAATEGFDVDDVHGRALRDRAGAASRLRRRADRSSSPSAG